MTNIIESLTRLHRTPLNVAQPIKALLAKRTIESDVGYFFNSLHLHKACFDLSFKAIEDIFVKSKTDEDFALVFELRDIYGVPEHELFNLVKTENSISLVFEAKASVGSTNYTTTCEWGVQGRMITLKAGDEVVLTTLMKADSTTFTTILSKEHACRITIPTDGNLIAVVYHNEDAGAIKDVITNDKAMVGVYTANINNKRFALLHEAQGFNPFVGLTPMMEDVIGAEIPEINPEAENMLTNTLTSVALISSCHFGSTEQEQFTEFVNSLMKTVIGRAQHIDQLVTQYKQEQAAKAEAEKAAAQAAIDLEQTHDIHPTSTVNATITNEQGEVLGTVVHEPTDVELKTTTDISADSQVNTPTE